jgi:hypothetical protein
MSTKLLSDRELIKTIGSQYGNMKTICEYLGISREALNKGCDKATRRGGISFLNLDRLLILWEYAKSHCTTEQTTLLAEQTKLRYSSASDFFGGIRQLGWYFRPAFTEMWIFARNPRELVEAEYGQQQMIPFWENPAITLVYFVPGLMTAIRLISEIRRCTDRDTQVSVVTSAFVEWMPHSIVMFEQSAEGQPDRRTGWVTTDHHLPFVPMQPEDVRHLIDMLRVVGSGGLINQHERFNWREQSVHLQSAFELPEVRLSYASAKTS